MKLSPDEKNVLQAIAAGRTLKSHRDLDGSKTYKLHPLGDGDAEAVNWATVGSLREKGLIAGNKKFPAATYLLTDKGKAMVPGREPDDAPSPLTTSGWN